MCPRWPPAWPRYATPCMEKVGRSASLYVRTYVIVGSSHRVLGSKMPVRNVQTFFFFFSFERERERDKMQEAIGEKKMSRWAEE